MKSFLVQLTAFVFVSGVLIITTASKNKETVKPIIPSSAGNAFVVMELFTSQGCSSCPPADNLLGKYASQNNDHIIPLAFHVDYWNRLGWKDSFSTSKFSDRQRDYALLIPGSSVYTPQLVINGEKEFVGSDAGKIAGVVENALKKEALQTISITKQIAGNNISVDYKLDKKVNNTTLNAALVQKQVFTNILRGENRGLKLTNYNVVRDFVSVHADAAEGGVKLKLPAGYSSNDFAVVLYVQDDASGRITGAIKQDL